MVVLSDHLQLLPPPVKVLQNFCSMPHPIISLLKSLCNVLLDIDNVYELPFKLSLFFQC